MYLWPIVLEFGGAVAVEVRSEPMHPYEYAIPIFRHTIKPDHRDHPAPRTGKSLPL